MRRPEQLGMLSPSGAGDNEFDQGKPTNAPPAISLKPTNLQAVVASGSSSSPRSASSSPGGPRSKSPLPPRPTSSPRNNTDSNKAQQAATFLSATASSSLRNTNSSSPSTLPATSTSTPAETQAPALSATMPILTAGRTVVVPIVAPEEQQKGEIYGIKEEENEDEGDASRSRSSARGRRSSALSTSSNNKASDGGDAAAAGPSRITSGAAAATAPVNGAPRTGAPPQLAQSAQGQEGHHQENLRNTSSVFNRLHGTQTLASTNQHYEEKRAGQEEHFAFPQLKPTNGHTIFDRLHATRTLGGASTMRVPEEEPEHKPFANEQHRAPTEKEKEELFNRLHAERLERAEWLAKQQKLKQEKEVEGLTFIPKLITEDYNQALDLLNDVSIAPGTDTGTHAHSQPKRRSSVYDRLYHGLEEKNEYYREKEEEKAKKEVEACTFVPEILEVGGGGGEEGQPSTGGKKDVWDKLYKQRQTLAERREAKREQIYKASGYTFTPELVTAATSSPAVLAAEEKAAADTRPSHIRLYDERKNRAARQQERVAKAKVVPGWTFTPFIATQNAAAPEKSSTTLDRTEQLYARGKEKGQRVLQKDIASRPPRAKRPEEECSFHPRTNWRKNAQEGDKGVPAFPPSTQK